MIVDFLNDHRANHGTGVDGTECGGELRWKLLFAHAVKIATEGHPVCGRAKANAVAVAGQVRRGIAGTEVE